MKHTVRFISLVILVGLAGVADAQGGQFGGGGVGGGGYGFGAGNQGQQQQQLQQEFADKTNLINQYLNGPEIKSVLTPGETVEWKLEAKVGQVFFADARSDAFDPALEIVDEKDKVLASNDDRYPGDQRPLLMWRCEIGGKYKLRARCFHDRSGGQVFVRFQSYQSCDLGDGATAVHEIDASKPFLLHKTMKQGEIIELVLDNDWQHYDYINFGLVISPTGLPDINLGGSFADVSGSQVLVAPVAGDYYFFARDNMGYRPARHASRANILGAGANYEGLKSGGNVFANSSGNIYSNDDSSTPVLRKIKLGTKEITVKKLTVVNGVGVSQGVSGTPNIWEVDLKAGQFMEFAADQLLYGQMNVTVAPNLSSYSLADPDKNPFYPTIPHSSNNGPMIEAIPLRAADRRAQAVFAHGDAKIWVCANGGLDSNGKPMSFDLKVRPAAADFGLGRNNQGSLKIGYTNWWTFEAKTGDVMTFGFTNSNYAQKVSIHDPEMVSLANYEMLRDGLNETSLIVPRPGWYFVSMSCVGDGGSGNYALSRQVIPAKEFDAKTPVHSEMKAKTTQVWKFTVKPDAPMIIRLRRISGYCNVAAFNDKGESVEGPFQNYIDEKNQYGILKVTEPTTYVLVFSGVPVDSSFSLSLTPLLDIGK